MYRNWESNNMDYAAILVYSIVSSSSFISACSLSICWYFLRFSQPLQQSNCQQKGQHPTLTCSAFKTADIQVATKHISGVDSGISDWFSSQHFIQVCSVHLLQISNGACGWEWGYSTLCAAELMGLSTFHKPQKSQICCWFKFCQWNMFMGVHYFISERWSKFFRGSEPIFCSKYQFQGKTILRSPFLLWQVPLSSVLSTLVNSLTEPDFRVQVWLHETNRSRPWLKVHVYLQEFMS